MKLTGWRRWAALVVSSATVAAATGSLYFALEAPVPEPAPKRDADRRAARSDANPSFVEVPLARFSRTHVGLNVHGVAVRGDAGQPVSRDARVLLDTGLSVPIATPDGARLFDLDVGSGMPIVSHGLSDRASHLYAIGDTQSFFVSVAAWDTPSRAATPVRYLGVDRLEGAHVILPPHILAPRNGAIRFDLRRDRFRVCESAAACLDGAGWSKIDDAPCADYPDLIVVRASLEGTSVRMLLDTGGATLVSEPLFDGHALAERATSTRDSELVGSGGASVRARRLEGSWSFAIGTAERVDLVAHELWIPSKLGGATATCHLDGSMGIDVLDGCELVIADEAPPKGFLRCK